MSDDRFTQTTLRAPRVDQDQAIATYQSGTHLLNYAYPAQHSGNETIDALLPDYNGLSTWDTAVVGTIIPYSFMDATLHYLDSASYADATDATTRGVYDADILELSDAQKNAIRMGLPEWARYIDVEFVEVTESNSEVGLLRFGGTTATGRVLGGIFGPNGENAGALLDASNANTVEFRGDFVARRTP